MDRKNESVNWPDFT